MDLKTFTINKQIELKAPVEKVFAALTSSEQIPNYFPLDSVESSWEVGSEVLYKGAVDGAPFTDFGVIEQLTPPTEYRYRYWSDNHGTQRTEDNHLTICYRLEKSNAGTVLRLTQSNIKSAEMYAMMNSQVWDFLLSSFKHYIESSTLLAE